MELVEQLGSGIPRVLLTYGRECFRFSDNYIRMSFPTEQGNVNEELNESLKSLLDVIYSHSGKQAKNYAVLLNSRPVKTVQRQIAQLIKRGLIERRGSRKTGGYYVVSNK